MSEQGFKIVQLTAENFKRLKAVSITPDGSTVLITGKNEAGKSSVLDAIMSALQGKNYTPERPLREGQEKGKVVVDMGAFKATRTFTAAGGGTLTVESKDGFKASTPQKMLDDIVGEIAFDPMNFINLGKTESGRKEQRSILMKLVGLSFDDLDKQIAEVKSQRSTANADKTRLGVELARLPLIENVPAEEVSIAELTAKLDEANKHNQGIANGKAKWMQLNGEVLRQQDHISGIDERMAALDKQMAEYIDLKQAAVLKLETITKDRDAAEVKDPVADTSIFQAMISNSEETNKKVRHNKARQDVADKLEASQVLFSDYGKKADKLETEKSERLSKTKFPIEGLGVDSNGVTYNGLPLSQECASKKLKIGVAISMAMNPKLKVIRMNGNELDADSLKVVSEMVEAAGYQVWVERISSDGAVGFVIEEGEVVQKPETTPELFPAAQ